MRRREFFGLVGGAAAVWPVSVRAQKPAMPVIGFLDPRTSDAFAGRLRGFHQGLREAGYVERENVAIEFRWAENRLDRLPALSAELVSRQVAVIVASGGRVPALAAKAATAKIPIVFIISDDPVKFGLVASIARPGGNLTGVNFVNAELSAKRLELLRELVPHAKRVAILVNPADAAATTEATLRQVAQPARSMGLEIEILEAASTGEIDAAFAQIGRDKPDALFVAESPLLNIRRVQVAQLAARHAIPTVYAGREHAEAGGLMSYGSSIADAYRQVGAYAGRILKGTSPADLPVVQASKFELVINHQTARMLGLTVPPTLLATADEVIE